MVDIFETLILFHDCFFDRKFLLQAGNVALNHNLLDGIMNISLQSIRSIIL